MKNFKRIAAMTAALTLAACAIAPMTAMNVGAAGKTTVSIPADSTHTYTAYQIFTGDWETVGSEKVLVRAKIGTGVDGAELREELGLDETAADIDVAKTLSAKSSTEIAAIVKEVLKETKTQLASTGVSLDKGYYYIVESDNSKTEDILICADDTITVQPKFGAPRVEKKIKEDDRTIEATGETIGKDDKTAGWNDAADYCIGEDVPFVIYGTLPENIGSYTNGYFYMFKDRLAKGYVKPDAEDFQVSIDGNEINNNKYSVVVEQADTGSETNIRIAFADITSAGVTLTAKSVVKVEYSAKLDVDAVVGKEGNTNGVTLVYTNDSSYNGKGIDTIKDDDENDIPDYLEEDTDEDGTPDIEEKTDKTAEDGVVAFTYTVSATKVDIDAPTTKLQKAEFKLYHMNEETKEYATVDKDGKFTGWGTDGSTLISDEDGVISVIGLDSSDTYYIEETKAPTGYNILKDAIPVVLTMSGMNNDGTYTYVVDNGTEAYGNLTSSKFDGKTAIVADGVVSGTIGNAKGSKLPSTGGMGTRLFVLGGGCAAALAGIYLISKKRVDAE